MSSILPQRIPGESFTDPVDSLEPLADPTILRLVLAGLNNIAGPPSAAARPRGER